MDQKPLDLEVHEGETPLSVWKRRLLFLLLIGLCVAFAAPTFGSCSGALGSGGSKVWGTFTVGGKEFVVRESDFVRARARLSAVMRMFDPQGERAREFGDDQVWAQLILDEAARAGGVHVGDADLRRVVEQHPAFQTAGRFDPDKYGTEMRQLQRWANVDRAEFESALRSLLRTETWRSVWATAYAIPQSKETWREWSKRNAKITVDWVVQPYAPLVAKCAEVPVTDEDIQRAKVLPGVHDLVTLPARRSYEVAFFRVHEVTAEQRDLMAKLAADAGLLPRDETLENVAWRQFWSNHKTGPYSRNTWLALKRPEYEARLAEWQKLPEPRPEDQKPKDPATEAYPEKPADQFYKCWRPFVESDVLGHAVLRHLAGRAERESKSFADLAADFQKYGVRVIATPEPLADADLEAKFPEGLGRDSELGSTIRTNFKAPEQGAAFVPKVVPDPVLVCQLNDRILDRGWIVVRASGYEGPRERDLAEVRPQVEAAFRAFRATELARDALVAIRTKVDAVAEGGVAAKREALRKFAEEAGLQVRTLQRFNAQTQKPTPPPVTSDPAAAAAAELARHRARVQDEYPFLSKLEPGKFRDPVILDERAGGAFLLLVVERQEPGPLEIDEASLESESLLRRFEARRSMTEHFAPKEVKAKYHLELTPEGRKATEREESGKPAE